MCAYSHSGTQLYPSKVSLYALYHHFANVGKIVDHFRGIKNMVYEGVNMNDKIQLFENQKIRTAWDAENEK